MYPDCVSNGCPLTVTGVSDMCADSNKCAIKELQNAGYEIHKKGQVEETEEAVATRLRLGDSPRGEQGDGDQGGERRYKTASEILTEPLSPEELIKLRKHMRMWPG